LLKNGFVGSLKSNETIYHNEKANNLQSLCQDTWMKPGSITGYDITFTVLIKYITEKSFRKKAKMMTHLFKFVAIHILISPA
jgi:hypothetical protein